MLSTIISPQQALELAWGSPGRLAIAISGIFAALLAFTVVFTWVLSTLRSSKSASSSSSSVVSGKRSKCEPPIAPYCIPFMQHVIAFLNDPGQLMRTMKAKYPNGPFTLLMMGTKFHVFDSQDTVSHVFGRSRIFAFEPVLASMMENGMGLPASDQPLFYLPHQRETGARESNSGQFVTGNHSIWLKYLSGKRLDEIMCVYTQNLNTLMAQQQQSWPSDTWFSVDLNELVQRMMFDVSALTFFGTRIKSYWPEMWEDWRAFNDATYVGVRSGLAYTLNPRAGKARERMLAAFERWIEDCDWDQDTESTPVWNKDWGYMMNREREMLARQHGFSLRGRACLHAGFLLVIVTNTAPMTTWFAWCASNTQERLQRYRKETASYLLPDADPSRGHYSFDRAALKTNLFVSGLWKEALRLGSASSAARVVMEDSEVEGYTLKQGSVILMPIALMHYDPNLFPQPYEVIPERWSLVEGEDAEKEKARLKRQALSLRSFGGGTGLCSGRFVAEEEVLLLVSSLLLMCDVEWDESWRSKYHFDPRSFGIMSPAKKPMVRMRLHSKAQ